jgi:hypothetical protein
MVPVRLLAMLLPVVLAACVRPSSHAPGAYDSQVITEDEIAASRATNALEAIQKLRANFLTYRGETSLYPGASTPYPTVYVDDQFYGAISLLKTIPAMQITSIKLYRSWEATTKYGTGKMGGVIAVTTRR